MYSGVNPEAIGIFGLIVTVIVAGMEQLGIGLTGADHSKVRLSLSRVAFWFGGLTQVFTALVYYLANPLGNPGMSIYLGTIFADFGLFWLLVSGFMKSGGDSKVMAHFFIVQGFVSLAFAYVAFKLGLIWPLGVVLSLIVLLFITLTFAYYGNRHMSKVAGVLNIAIGICATPLFIKALMETVLKH